MFKCKECEERHPACHSTCEMYQQERTRLDEVNKARRLDSEYHVCAKVLSMERKKKWLNKKR